MNKIDLNKLAPNLYLNKIVVYHALCNVFIILFLVSTAAYYLPRHLHPGPGYSHHYPPYLIRGFPETAALENRQTLFNDYITSQQMHQWPAAAAMAAQRPDLLRGLTSREQSLNLTYSPTPRGEGSLKGLLP